MSTTRPIIFWIAMLAAVIAAVVLLRDVLLPFVAGMVLAYLLDPVADRIERLGMNRLLATLVIIVFVVAALAILIVLTVPVIIRELSRFIEDLPLYVHRVHMLATDPNHPWLSKIIGEGLGETEHSIGELTTFASSWFDTILRSVWSGGRALISIISLGMVAPIVACYPNLRKVWGRVEANQCLSGKVGTTFFGGGSQALRAKAGSSCSARRMRFGRAMPRRSRSTA